MRDTVKERVRQTDRKGEVEEERMGEKCIERERER